MTPSATDFVARMSALKGRFEQRLLQETASRLPPGRLGTAMAYALRSPGKRLRPLLCYATAEALGLEQAQLDLPAVALELVHTYSLAHDDLPAMDDDDLRRGRPSLHKAYDEATAILAGDALLTLAFELLASADAPAAVRLQWVREMAVAAGALGMVQGQSLDLQGQGRALTLAELTELHSRKTGRMVTLGIRLAAALKEDLPAAHMLQLETFGHRIGLAYQVKDDLLDVTASTETLGKPQGSDQRRQKPTFASLLGVAAATQKLAALLTEAEAALATLPFATGALRHLARYIVERPA